MLPDSLIQNLGIAISGFEPVTGGDINFSYCLTDTAGQKYFLKFNHKSLYPSMLAKEANGLLALQQHSDFIIPVIIKQAESINHQYLLLQWIEQGSPAKDFWESFAASLAVMHRQQQSFFGWPEDNFIGSLPQPNSIHNSWSSFYSHCRIMPLAIELFNRSHWEKQDIDRTESLCDKLHNIFPPEQPSLLHGDLWAGNFMISPNGKPVLIDPAVYYGHREMDIAMSLLFGGFDQRFYEAYNNIFPMKTGWKTRIQLAQLYPVMVHAILFGGHYIQQAKAIIRHYS